jgi:PhnB protein
MGSDGCGEDPGFKGFTLALNVATEAEADRYFNALTDGGKINMPLSKTFWSPRFGMVEDKFGMRWMVSVVQECGK